MLSIAEPVTCCDDWASAAVRFLVTGHQPSAQRRLLDEHCESVVLHGGSVGVELAIKCVGQRFLG